MNHNDLARPVKSKIKGNGNGNGKADTDADTEQPILNLSKVIRLKQTTHVLISDSCSETSTESDGPSSTPEQEDGSDDSD